MISLRSFAILTVCALHFLCDNANAFVVVPATVTSKAAIHHPLNNPKRTLAVEVLSPSSPGEVKKRHNNNNHSLSHVNSSRISSSSVALGMLPTRAIVSSLFTVAVAAASSAKIVQQGNVAIVERFGKFQQCLGPGLHFVIPFADQVARRVSEREQVFDIPPQKCITKDNAPLLADAVVYWKVLDAKETFYSVQDLDLAIQNLVLTQLRSEIGKLTLDETFSAREQINSVLLRDLDVETKPWGIKINRVEVRDIIPNSEILGAMEMQMAAERKKRAAVIESEGEKLKAINEAEGEAQSRIIDAKADAEAILIEGRAEAEKMRIEAEGASRAIEALAKTLNGDPSDAAKYKLAQQFIDTQGRLATSDNAKVILSNSDNASDALVKALAIYSGEPMTS
mmetsp:Transcript_18831/g.28208  ORF Transcript_18831/g.28208 Transcript_18831/m.28208 type:complete len:396 (+) Transcript_18831:76-1263(+)